MKRLLWTIVALVLFVTPCLAAEEIELVIGDTLEMPYLTFTLDTYSKLDQLRFTEKETGSLPGSLSKTKDDATYIAIKGFLMNTSKSAIYLYDCIRGVAIIDGYEYNLGIYATDLMPEPLSKHACYLYALVPNVLAQSDYESCVFKLGVFEDVNKNWYDYNESLDYDYKYTITLK